MRLAAAFALAGLITTSCSFGGPSDDATGEEIYAELCASCHAPDLSGGLGPPLDSGSNAAIEDDEYLEFTITNGRGRMPSFSSSLDETQMDRLVDFIRQEQDA